MLKKQTREYRLNDLSKAIQSCDLCPRMSQRTKVLSAANGNVNSKILFIAEAPGRHGADKTGIPLYGDKTGNNFDRLLGNIGWQRKDVFITNTILCNPREDNGNNGTPTFDEIHNCSTYLEMTINLVQPEVIVTLGRVALESLRNMYSHTYSISNNVAELLEFHGRKLFPLYHPGPMAMFHRNLHKQTADFFKLSKIADPINGLVISKHKFNNKQKNSEAIVDWQIIHQIILAIVRSLKILSYFKLTKLLYLMDLYSLDKIGATVTGQTYIRQQEGPWMPQLSKYVKQMNEHELCQIFKMGKPIIRLGASPRFNVSLKNEEIEMITNILNKYGNMSDSDIKIAVYRTKPMREILKKEKSGNKTKNIPIIHKNKTILDFNSLPA